MWEMQFEIEVTSLASRIEQHAQPINSTTPSKRLSSRRHSLTQSAIMLEARLAESSTLKRVLDSVKELVSDANFDCNDGGLSLQAMDNSHVALVSLQMKEDMFEPYRCDRNIALGINLTSLSKVLKCANNDDVVTIKATDEPDVLNLQFESQKTERFSEYDLKLMDIDQEHLGIPDTGMIFLIIYASIIGMGNFEIRHR